MLFFLLYSTGNSTQYSVMAYMEKNLKKCGYMCACVCVCVCVCVVCITDSHCCTAEATTSL